MSKKSVKILKRNLFETAFILLLADLIWMYSGFQNVQLIAGVTIVVLVLLIPKSFFPITWILMFSGKLLSKFVPLIFLSLVFFCVITPVAFLRRVLGKDLLKLAEFKRSGKSVFITRNEEINADKILHPY